MFLRLTFICFVLCVFGQVNSTPTFGTNQSSSGGGNSFIGDVLRRKAQFFDDIRNHLFPAGHTGTSSVTYSGRSNGQLYGQANNQAYGQLYGQANGQLSGQANGHVNSHLHTQLNGKVNVAIPIPNVTPAVTVPSIVVSSTTVPSIIVPSTALDLISTILYQGYLDATAAQNLPYAQGNPELLFQYVNEFGQIIPITQALAVRLVPNVMD